MRSEFVHNINQFNELANCVRNISIDKIDKLNVGHASTTRYSALCGSMLCDKKKVLMVSCLGNNPCIKC